MHRTVGNSAPHRTISCREEISRLPSRGLRRFRENESHELVHFHFGVVANPTNPRGDRLVVVPGEFLRGTQNPPSQDDANGPDDVDKRGVEMAQGRARRFCPSSPAVPQRKLWCSLNCPNRLRHVSCHRGHLNSLAILRPSNSPILIIAQQRHYPSLPSFPRKISLTTEPSSAPSAPQGSKLRTTHCPRASRFLAITVRTRKFACVIA